MISDEGALGSSEEMASGIPENRHFVAKGRSVFYICSPPPRRQPMSFSVSAAPAAAARSRAAATPRAARRNKAGRETRLLSDGASIGKTAAREGEKRTRTLLQESLARRLPGPPAELVAPKIGRLDEALRVPRAMAKANLEEGRPPRQNPTRARRHSRVPRSRTLHRAGPLRLAAPAQNPLALPAPPFAGSQMAPQAIEKPRFAPGNGAPFVALYGVHACHRTCSRPPGAPSPRSGEGVAAGDGWGVESRAHGPQARGNVRASRLTS